ncbi:transcriptional regulator [Robertmurraya siralis]|uniref:Transcriptional regulator n=1 Tax=Robertmurraya siralis TaxID=77777 RepID=A0A919WIS7_9BACI|nr:PRD domain-containing protein [Robertmurraya siralis]PAE18413.1 transcriptional regulator [Bacillus sp. 7504-2]GIN62474.1 transcriptional regulator [Robertmurraya siralis]
MKAIKKINNNVAICTDNNNKELIAFGRGIGFPPMPYEIKDLSSISMTFYRIDNRFYNLMEEIPENIFEVTALIVDKARKTLSSPLNPNLLIGLADHINFAIIRLKKYKKMQMLFSYDVEQLYPIETNLGRYAVELVKKRLGAILPESEVTNIAMHFVNAQEEKEPVTEGPDTEALISEVADKIEGFFSINIDRASFNYNRFAMHMRYYLKRIKEETQFMNDNSVILQVMKENNEKVYDCAFMIGNFIDEKLESKTTDDEILYLMMHINRIIKNTKI